MCIICQTVSLGAALITGALPVAVPETSDARSTTPPPAIAGTTCKTLGQQRTSGGVRFTCTATKTKRVWRRTSAPGTSTTTTSTTTTAVTTTTTTIPRGYLKPTCGPGVADCPTVSAATAVAECKIADATPGDVAQGFPRPSRAKPGKAVLDLLVVPVRYAGSTATEASVRADFEKEFRNAREFFERNSYKRVVPNFTLEAEAQWVSIDVTWQQFVNARGSDLKRVTQDVVTLIPRQNLGAFDSIFIVEAGGTTYWGGMDQTAIYTHASGQVHSVYFQTGPASNTYFQHNVGHTAYYLEDLYLHPYYRTSPDLEINPMKHDVMSTGNDFSGWNRWLAGFLLDSEVRCASASAAQTTHRLTNLNRAAGEKLAMVPLGSGKALFAEYIDDGVHVYSLDSNVGHGAGPMKTLGLLAVGQSITYAGVQVTVNAVDATSVYVSVKQ
jgi:hypothetical protein